MTAMADITTMKDPRTTAPAASSSSSSAFPGVLAAVVSEGVVDTGSVGLGAAITTGAVACAVGTSAPNRGEAGSAVAAVMASVTLLVSAWRSDSSVRAPDMLDAGTSSVEAMMTRRLSVYCEHRGEEELLHKHCTNQTAC